MNESIPEHGTTIKDAVTRQLHEGKIPNRLIREKSPYLLQHAFNPVDWYPWGEEAFAKARAENKPIFLSVGYSTCYWCHVMEREIFEDEAIAAMMNRSVVSIKVDREERPDVDHVYMTALQAMTGSGGWPMSIFMTPDRKPFFAATYLPPVRAYGRASFPDVLERIRESWQNEQNGILAAGEKVCDFLMTSVAPRRESREVGREVLDRGFEILAEGFDSVHGGFGTAPKFPRPVALNFLFRCFSRTGDRRARDMALTTLRKMAEGGMYDQMGGGFHRYATDDRWHVPHFEKMLVDQSQLAVSCLEAYQITHDAFFRRIAEEVLEYVRRVMIHPEGGFCSAEDAESAVSSIGDEKSEGAFYVWTRQDLRALLDDDEAAVFEYSYGVEPDGNVPTETHGPLAGQNVLYAAHGLSESAQRFGRLDEDVRSVLESARKKVLLKREGRPRPLLDDKVLLSWNGLMISAFARAAQVLGKVEYGRTAVRAARFVLQTLSSGKDGTLLRRYRDGEARYDACLSDYAFLVQGLLDLYEATFDIEWLIRSVALTEQQIQLFADPADGGFFDTSGVDGTVLFRSKETYDGAEPTGNAIALLNLLRLSQMIGDARYQEIAERSIACFGGAMQEQPEALLQFLVAVDFRLSKPKQIVIAGSPHDAAVRAMIAEVHRRFIPRKVLLLADGGRGQQYLSERVPFLAGMSARADRATAYVCENYSCQIPATDIAQLRVLLG